METLIAVSNTPDNKRLLKYLYSFSAPRAEYYASWNLLAAGDKDPLKNAITFDFVVTSDVLLRKINKRFGKHFKSITES